MSASSLISVAERRLFRWGELQVTMRYGGEQSHLPLDGVNLVDECLARGVTAAWPTEVG